MSSFARVALCALLVAVAVSCVLAVPLSALDRSRVHGALNRRLSAEQMSQRSLGDIVPQWHTQTLDHQNRASSVTFQQQYYVNDTFYLAAKPRVFIMLGGEGPISPHYVTDHFIVGDLAAQYSALICTLEHRFYGQSVPGNDSSTKNLQYLSSTQALEDLVTFREALTTKLSLPSNTVWIVFGGSYSGSLAAWARSKYPQLFHGAFATSAPVQAQLEFNEYFDVTAASLGATCSANLAASTDALTNLLATDRASLQSMFNLCTPIVTTNDVANFLSTLTGPIANIVQYNEDNNSYEMYDITKLCATLEGASSPLEGLVAVWNDYNTFTNNTACTDTSYQTMIKELQPTSDGRSWTWQTCVEFGYFQDATKDGSSPAQPFSTQISLQFYLQQCQDIFNIQGLTPNIQYTNDFYGGNQIVTSNTVFADGTIDPWHILGTYQTFPSTALSQAILIDGTAHCADLYPPRDSDLPGLTAARKVQNGLLAQWLATANPAHSHPRITLKDLDIDEQAASGAKSPSGCAGQADSRCAGTPPSTL